MRQLLTLEFGVLALFTALAFTIAGFDWWWLLLLFLVIDVSMVGYLISPLAGAVTYNMGHSIIGPVVLLSIYLIHGQQWELFIALIWLFHIFVDRALGYGLKHSDDFKHTHLGWIGKN